MEAGLVKRQVNCGQFNQCARQLDSWRIRPATCGSATAPTRPKTLLSKHQRFDSTNESSNHHCTFLFGCHLGGGRVPIGNDHKACHCHSILLARSLLVNLSILGASNRSHDIVERATPSCYTSQVSTFSGTIEAPEAVLIQILRDGGPCINLPSIGARHAS